MSKLSKLPALYDDVRTIDHPDQAVKWIEYLYKLTLKARDNCFKDWVTVKEQQSAYHKLMIHYGSLLGTIRALHACGKVEDVFYSRYVTLSAEAVRSVVTKIILP